MLCTMYAIKHVQTSQYPINQPKQKKEEEFHRQPNMASAENGERGAKSSQAELRFLNCAFCAYYFHLHGTQIHTLKQPMIFSVDIPKSLPLFASTYIPLAAQAFFSVPFVSMINKRIPLALQLICIQCHNSSEDYWHLRPMCSYHFYFTIQFKSDSGKKVTTSARWWSYSGLSHGDEVHIPHQMYILLIIAPAIKVTLHCQRTPTQVPSSHLTYFP